MKDILTKISFTPGSETGEYGHVLQLQSRNHRYFENMFLASGG